MTLMQVTATQAKNRFGAMCAQAKTEPVFVEKDGRIDTVIVSAKQFSELQSANHIQTFSQRKAQFEQSHSSCVTDRRYGATDVRRNGASNRWVKRHPEGVKQRWILPLFGRRFSG